MISEHTVADESAVLRACLGAMRIGPRQVVRSFTGLTILDEELDRTTSHLRWSVKELDEQTLADFVAKNRQGQPVAGLVHDARLICVSAKELEAVFGDEAGWDRFRAMYPESAGVIEFSRVGFNSKQTQALVYAGMQLDWLAGDGTYRLYSKADDAWVESGRALAWVS
jgi:hypothetical protein